ncbi:stress response NST1-like isoform X2 [Olea europaea subsp. europaea]|uniref:Stress response NST1-like isoform X2 n=1 Tax=Olea europaea subsp. europaea TaxID=158383 RepID=A0A8S0SB87_OLEEU|nr:stress response NST1-like isoform X2 [Olea europaea subsp. europaea]
MNQFRAPQFAAIGVATRKRRSQISHRSIPESQPVSDRSPIPSTPLSDEMSKVSSDENIGDANSRRKIFNLNQCISRGFPPSGSDGGPNVLFTNGVLGDATANESKPKRVTLKVGGVMHTIQTKSSSNGSSSDGSLAKIDQLSNIGRARQNLVIQENSYRDHSTSLDRKSSLQGIPWKDFSGGGFNLGKEDINKMPAKNAFEKQGEKLVPVRKSKRAPKRHVLDEEFDEDDDAEIRYLKKLKNAKVGRYKDLETESTKYQHSLPRISKKFNSESAVEGIDYEDELLSDGEPEGKKKKKQKDLSDIQIESKREMTLTTRQRALLFGKDASSPGLSQIEFPDGLPLPPRKQKEKLSEVEQQTKKAEAAQKRKIQNEKAARELEAEAIRKILSQDSSRKKKEDKIKKRLEELAQEKVANAKTLASNTIRWTMQSTGTIVTFSQDMGLPKIFDSKPLR